MTQLSLLELARNGNPQAIASLMNQVLEPKGVVAKTQLEGNCLHIIFTSEHLLSQSAIANFVKNGLGTLGTKSFQTIKLYAQKIGQDSPLWVDSFSLTNAISAQPVVSVPPVAAAAPPKKPPASLPNVNSAPQPASVPVRPVPALEKRRKSRTAKSKPHHAIARSLQQVVGRVEQWSIGNRFNNRYQLAIAVSAGAFLIGGTSALLSHTQANRSSQATGAAGEAMLPLSSQSLVQSDQPDGGTSPETQVERYLAQMNKTQQVFYQANGRFAATLEELERSASILSHSTHYTYRLVVRDQAQSVLTATPKQEGLKSYSSTVLAADPAKATAMVAIICKTNQSSNFPPILAQAAGQPVQCPADATQVSN